MARGSVKSEIFVLELKILKSSFLQGKNSWNFMIGLFCDLIWHGLEFHKKKESVQMDGPCMDQVSAEFQAPVIGSYSNE